MKQGLILLFLFFGFYIFGQKIRERSPRNFQLGFSSSIDRTNKSSYDYIPQCGFSSEIYFSSRQETKNRRFQIGILFAQMNYKTQHIFDGTETDYDGYFVYYRNVNLLEFPIKYNFFVFESNKIKVYGILGFSAGGILKSVSNGYNYSTDTGDLMYVKPPYTIPYTEGILGLYLGGGMEYFVDERFSLTFEPELKIKYQVQLLGPDIYSAMGINLGIRWNY